MFTRLFSPRPLVPALLALGFTSLCSVPQPVHAQTAQVSQKPALTVLHRFDGKYGAYASAPLLLGKDGNFYGTTSGGERDPRNYTGFGTVFMMTPQGAFKTLFIFNYDNGENPVSKLVQVPDGSLYGTTGAGGKPQADGRDSGGTIFKITPSGDLVTVYTFYGTQAGYPYGKVPRGLIFAADHNLYGISSGGGKSSGDGRGTIFRLTLDGQLSVLHSFDKTNGSYPHGALVQGSDGSFYGTTSQGGKYNKGVVFRMRPSGSYAVLHHFNGGDGYSPEAALVEGKDGNFYGSAYQGSTLFKITPTGQFTILHRFSDDGHGIGTFASLVPGSDGLFYSTTAFGGSTDYGTVFSMTSEGRVTTLYEFHTAFDGRNAFGGVTFGPDGALYGTTSMGGSKGSGTIFKLTLPQ